MDSDLESASNSFSKLDIIDKNNKKNMDNIDIDPVFEGSNGPERMRGEVGGEFDIPQYNPKKASSRKKYMHTRQWNDSRNQTVGSNSTSTARNDAENLCRRAGLAHVINNTLDMVPQTQDDIKETETSISNGSGINTSSLDDMVKNSSPASHHSRHRRSRKKKGKERLPVFDGGDITLEARDRGKTVGLAGTARNDAENLCRRARLAHVISNTLDMVPQTQVDIKETETSISNGSGRNTSSLDDMVKNSSSASHHSRHRRSRKNKGKERLPVFDGGDITLEARDKGKTVGLAGGAFASRRSQSVWQRKPEQSGYISAFASRNGNSNDGKCLDNSVNFGLCSSHVAVGSMKETNSDNIAQPDAGPGIPSYNRVDVVRKNYGPRKLAQAVGVSNYNMAHDNNHENSNWVIKSGHSELSEGASAHQTPIHDSEGRHADRRGKLLLDDNFVNVNHQGNAKPHFGRVRSIVGKEVEDCGWRRTHDHTNKAPACSLQESPSVSKRGKDTYNCVPHQSSEIATGYRDHANHLYESQRWKKHMISKRKNNSVHSSYGESSSSTIDGSEASNLQSSGHFANPELTRGYDSSNLPEQSGRTPVDSSTKVSQVESDEILARQLQEQFYHELEGFGGSEEVDTAIEWSLQQDDARHSASLARSSPFNHRDTSMAHLYAYYARLPQTTNRDQAPTSSRRDNYNLGMDYETRMMAEVRRSFNSAQMGRETRHNLLEAMEATFGNSNDMFSENVLHTRRDFNESDYEMLLTLDENNHYHVGASEDQINSLPQSVIQSDNIQEACAICLEAPSVGDVIRPLPCLHKFHKECVDTWLRRKSSCPVCKSEITI